MSEWQAGEAKEWSEAAGPAKPFVEGAKTFIGGKVEEATGEIIDVTSPIVDSATGKRAVIGSLIQMTAAEAMKAAQAASDAWDDGQGPYQQAWESDWLKVDSGVHRVRGLRLSEGGRWANGGGCGAR